MILSSYRRPAVVLVLTALFRLFLPMESFAQTRVTVAPPVFIEDETYNIFAHLVTSDPADGFRVDFPPGWRLVEAVVVKESGISERVDLREIPEAESGILGFTRQEIMAEDRIVLRVQAGRGMMSPVISVTPVNRSIDPFGAHWDEDRANGFRIELTVRPRPPETDNKVGAFVDGQDPLRISASDLPELSYSSSHTVEFWVRTLQVDQVVLSTWDGRESSPYPFEFVVDAAGHLVVFQGTGQRHVSMRSLVPVADGAWHHVAFVQNTESRWSRLLMDGTRQDSLFMRMAPPDAQVSDLGVGNRLGGGGDDPVPGFEGWLDELRIWGGIRTDRELARARNSAHPDMANGDYRESFDDAGERFQASTVRRVASTLTFRKSLEQVEIDLLPSGVRLAWGASLDPGSTFLVERSSDGRTFDVIAKRRPDVSRGNGANHMFIDPETQAGVYYYRIRRRYPDGSEELSRTMKIGLGVDDSPRSAYLTGNFPNPFNPSTVLTLAIEESQAIHLSVWDLSGQQVSVLVDQVMSAGNHEVQFTAGDLPSGTYFVRLRSNEGIQTRQIILMK